MLRGWLRVFHTWAKDERGEGPRTHCMGENEDVVIGPSTGRVVSRWRLIMIVLSTIIPVHNGSVWEMILFVRTLTCFTLPM